MGSNGGVIAGLASFGIIMNIVLTPADLMQDLKTLPLSMFISQILGTALGCIIAPLTFWMFWNAFDIGYLHGQYLGPFAVIYREMSIIGVEGLSPLLSYYLELCGSFFLSGLVAECRPRHVPVEDLSTHSNSNGHGHPILYRGKLHR